MSRDIDERVVEMRFDNSNFEKNAKDSIDTLDQLDKALQLKNAGKGLDNLQQAAKNFTLVTIANTVDQVQEKFNAFEHLAVGALENIGLKAEETAERYLKMFTVDNITAGWTKFGDKTMSVATLVSQLNPETGVNYTLEEVNEQLERLNWFTDETSYNFTDMVSNIAKFTATGQGLETSVSAMEGIALWASRSGQSAQKASMAMYQLAQAMGKGALKYDDYKSIQNASMDTQEFRKAALDTAVALGKVQEAADGAFTVGGKVFEDMNAMFTSDALSRTQWLDTDVMMETFNKYGSAVNQIYDFAEKYNVTAGEAIRMMQKQGIALDEFGVAAFKAGQEARTFGDVVSATQDAVSTGWMNTFEYIFGNYEEARDLWSAMAEEFYNIFAEPGNQRNLILAGWYEGEGRKSLLNALSNLYSAFKNLILPIQNAWKIIFPQKTAEQATDFLLDLTHKLEKFSEKILAFVDMGDQVEEWFMAPLQSGSALFKDSEFIERFRQFAGWVDEAGKPIGMFAKYMGVAGDTVEDTAKELNKVTHSVEELHEVAQQVIRGDWGNGEERIRRLTEAGYQFEAVQNIVNELLGCSFKYKVATEETTGALGDQNKTLNENAGAISDVAEEEEEIAKAGYYATHNIGRLERIFIGLFSIVDIVKQGLQAVGEALLEIGQHIMDVVVSPLVDWLLDVGASLGEQLLLFDMMIRETKPFKKILDPIVKAVKTLVDILAGFAKTVWPVLKTAFDFIGKLLSSITKVVKNLFDQVRKVYSYLDESGSIEILRKSLEDVWEVISTIASTLATTIGGKILSFFDGLSESIGGFDVSAVKDQTNWLSTISEWISSLGETVSNWKGIILDFFNGLFTQGGAIGEGSKAFNSIISFDSTSMAETIKKALDDIWGKIVEGFEKLPEDIKKRIGNAWKTITDKFQEITQNFDIDVFLQRLKEIGTIGVLGTLASGLFKLGDALSSIPKTFSDLLGAITDAIGTYQTSLKADTINKVSQALIFMAAALFILTFADQDKLYSSAVALSGVLVVVGFLVKAFAEFKQASAIKYANMGTGLLQKFLGNVANAFKTGVKIASFGVLAVGIGAAILMIIMGLMQIIKIPESDYEKLYNALGLISGLMLELVLFMAILNRASGKNKVGIGTAVAMIATVVGVQMLVGTFVKLIRTMNELQGENIDPSTYFMAFGAITLLMSLLAATAVSMQNTDWKSFLAFAVSMLAVNKTIGVFTKSLTELAPIAGDALIAAIAIGGVTAAILALTKILGGSDNQTFVKGTVLLLAASAGIYVLGQALASIAKLGGTAYAGILAVAVALGTIIGIAYLASNPMVSDGMFTLSAGLLSVGVGAVLFAAAAALIGVALGTIGQGFADLLDGLARAGETLRTRIGDIAIAVAAVVGAIAAGIVLAKGGVFQAVGELLTGIGETIVAIAPKLAHSLWAALVVLLTFLTEVMPGLITKVGILVLVFLNGVVVFLNNNLEAIKNILMNLVTLIVNVLISLITEVMSWIADAIGGFVGFFNKEAGEDIHNMADTLRNDLQENLFEMREVTFNSGTEAADGYVDGMVTGITDGAYQITGASDENANLLAETGGDPYEAAGMNMGGLFVNAESEGILSGGGLLNNALQDVNFDAVDYLNTDQLTQLAQEQGLEIPEEYANGILGNMDLVSGATESVASEGAENANSSQVQNNFKTAGNDNVKAFASSISSTASQNAVRGATITAARGARSAAPSAKGNGRYVGDAMVEGMLAALNSDSNKSKVRSAAEKMAESAANAAKAKLDINSPSKVFMKIFDSVPEGAAKGITRSAYMVEEAAKDMGSGAIETAKNYLSRVSDFIESDINTNPTITPVLDLSSIQNGSVYANKMLAGIGSELAWSGSFGNVTLPRSANEIVADALNGAVADISNTVYGRLNDNTNYTIEVPVVLDGREVARVTAPYTKNEIARLDRNNSRRGGIL